MSRTGPSDTAHRVTTSTVGRGTIREIDDDHLCQECKTGDTGFSRTHTSFEMWTPLGMTATAVKQKEDDKKQQGQQAQQGGQDWNKNQPQGEAAEFIVNYVNGSSSHPVGMTNDRRARPYGLRQGEAAFYAADGSGQMAFHRVHGDNADGFYIVSLDDQQGDPSLLSKADGQGGSKRMISIRHANKKKQRRKKEQKQQQSGSGGGGPQSLSAAAADGGSGNVGGQDTGELPDGSKSNYKHEGDSVNTEAQFTSQRINFNEGGGDIGYYDRKKDWMHHMPGDKKKSHRCDKDHTHIMSEQGQVIWVDSKTKNCYSSKPIIIKPDECDV